MFMRLIFLFVFVVLCAGDIKDETEDRLLKFRDDINQISLDFENFIYDIVKESLSSTDMLVNGNSDPNVRANAILKALTPTGRNVLGKKSTDFKEILHKYANSDILPTTQKSIVDNVLDNYREKAANLLSRNGLKRTRRDAVIPGIVNTRYFNTNNDKSDECSKRIQQEKILEHQHIEDLKEEVKKLHDLVILLKDQQKIMTLLDDQSAQDFQPSEMFKTLENDKKNETENDRRNDIIPGIKPNAEEPKPTHEELEKMKYDIKQTILALNNTREILINERDRELDLEKELKRQKLELKLLKLMVEKLYQNNTFFEYPPVNNGSTQEDIVGAPIHHPKVIPKIQNKNTTRYSTSFNFRRRNEGLSPRANELDDLLKELDKKNREENIKKLLVKLLEDKESKTLETKNEDTELIKKLQKLLETMNRPQSKIDGDVESELKKLENAINTLKPKDPLDLEDSAEDLVKLKDLINGMSAKDLPNAGGSSNRGLTQQQINELRRRLQQVSTSNAAGNMFPSNGADFGFGMQHSDIGKKGFSWNKLPPYSEAFGNYPPSLDPYRPTSYGNFYGLQPNGYGYTFPQAPPPNPYPAEGYGPFGISHQYQPSYGGPIYGGNTDNLSYGTKPYGQPFEGYPSYGSNSVPADYNKQFGVNSYGASQKPLPYAQAGSGTLGYTPTDTGGQFFQSGQSNTYDKTVPSAIYAPDNPDGNHPGQPAAHLSKNTHGVDYKAKNIEELKTQISSLQNIINSLNYSGYVKKPEDQETIAGLEQQINELKGIINSLSQDNPPSQPSYNPNPPNTPSYIQPGPSYSRNSPGYNQNQPNLNTRRKRSLDESIYNTSSQVVDQVVSKWKDYLFQEEKPEEKITYKNVQARINNLKAQLDHLDSPRERQYESRSYEPYQLPGYYQNYYYPTVPKVNPYSLVPPKKQDLFNDLVAKILDKIIGAIPTALEKIFGSTIYHLVNFNYQYSNSYDYQPSYYGNQYDLANLFKSFGVLGWFPLIMLKIIDGITTFVSILKKNKFFKNFLLPALLLIGIAGAVIFLIWWMQPDDYYYKQIGYDKQHSYSNYNYNPYNRNKYYNSNQNGYRSNNRQIYDYGINNNINNRYEVDNYNRNINGLQGIYRSYFEN